MRNRVVKLILVIFGIGAAALGAWYFHSHKDRLVEWIGAIGELAIAFVIYYEIEQNRVSEFLREVQGSSTYRSRAKLYDAYASLSELTAAARTRAFCDQIRRDPLLRANCDAQWTYFSRARFGLRWSCHRHLLAEWFPQVVVKFWVMTHLYLREREHLRAAPMNYGVMAVKECLHELLKRRNPPPLIISSNDGQREFEIPVSHLQQLLNDLECD